MRLIGTAVFVLVVIAGTLWGTGYIYEKRARDFSERVTKSIFEEWNYEAVQKDAMAELRKSLRANVEGPKLLQWGNDGLGPLEDAGRPDGSIAFRWGKYVRPLGLVGQYEFDARFKKGRAHLEIGVVLENGEWRISRYRFDSPQLSARDLERLVSPPPNTSLERTRER